RFVLAVNAENLVELPVDEAGEQARAEPRRTREPEQVREHRARVPVQVTVAALAVLPGRPPEDAAEDEHGAGTRRLGRERRPHVLLPQPAQRVLERMELVE